MYMMIILFERIQKIDYDLCDLFYLLLLCYTQIIEGFMRISVDYLLRVC